jgi:hypothetical protein
LGHQGFSDSSGKERRDGVPYLIVLTQVFLVEPLLTMEKLLRNDGLFASESIGVWEGLNACSFARREVSMLKWMDEIRVEGRGNSMRRPVWT